MNGIQGSILALLLMYSYLIIPVADCIDMKELNLPCDILTSLSTSVSLSVLSGGGCVRAVVKAHHHVPIVSLSAERPKKIRGVSISIYNSNQT